MTESRAQAPDDVRSLGRYYNASQLRADTWNQLKHHAGRLAEQHINRRETAKLVG